MIKVEVADASSHGSLRNARVFVLSDEGKEIASTTTNDLGIAWLPSIEEGQHPKYLIVEHPGYFLSGVRWRASREEYYILATILTVK